VYDSWALTYNLYISWFSILPFTVIYDVLLIWILSLCHYDPYVHCLLIKFGMKKWEWCEARGGVVCAHDYSRVRHPLGHRLIKSTRERASEMGVWFLSKKKLECCVCLLLVESWYKLQIILLFNTVRKNICWVGRACS